jgi:hypothetical protein
MKWLANYQAIVDTLQLSLQEFFSSLIFDMCKLT